MNGGGTFGQPISLLSMGPIGSDWTKLCSERAAQFPSFLIPAKVVLTNS